MSNCRLPKLAHRFWAWFVRKPYIEVQRVRVDGDYTISTTGERYTLVVHPRGEKVIITVDSLSNEWLRRAARADEFDHLAAEADPEDAEAARDALVREADKCVAAARKAWELGWRPAVD